MVFCRARRGLGFVVVHKSASHIGLGGMALKEFQESANKSRRQKKSVPTVHPETSAAPASATFPIVGIGASAGGLEALDQFLGRVPTGSGHNVAMGKF
jgi:chemotaxis response regulator CheB